MPATQKALLLEAKQGKYVVGNRDIPKPGPGQLLVKVQATGLNPVDWKIQKYGIIIQEFPAVIGSDAAGDVEEVGAGVTNVSKGDRVFFQGQWANDRASHQQYTLADAVHTTKIPAKLSYDEAATIPAGIVAAYLGLYNTAPKGFAFSPPLEASARGLYSGKPLIVLGGSSNVGQYTIQFAKLSGFSPIIVTSSLKHSDYLKSLGATHIIDRNLPLAPEVKKITTDPITHIYDTVSTKETQQPAHDLLAAGGKLGILLPSEVSNPDEGKVLFIFGSPTPQNRDILEVLWKRLPGLIEEGVIRPSRFELLGGLQGIVDGFKRLENNQVSGVKLIAHPQESA